MSSATPDLAATVGYVYDGSFEGLLSVVFAAFERQRWPHAIMPENQAQAGLFGQHLAIITDTTKADRVWQGVDKRVSETARTNLFYCYLSDLPGREMILFAYLRLVFQSTENIETNFAAESVRQVERISKKVSREKHRMEAFVRFQKTADGLFVSTIDPDHNVLPLIKSHFQKRYADQRWVIYDTRRHYGLYYNGQDVVPVTLEQEGVGLQHVPDTILDPEEVAWQALWQVYFTHVNIPARKNLKLQLRQLPRRYWKYLPEKQIRKT